MATAKQLDEIAFRYTAFSNAINPTSTASQIASGVSELVDRLNEVQMAVSFKSQWDARVQALVEMFSGTGDLDDALTTFNRIYQRTTPTP